jgi:hypothetical protein
MKTQYNKSAVNKAIENSKSPISKKESRLIHALLIGHGKDTVDNEKEPTR